MIEISSLTAGQSKNITTPPIMNSSQMNIKTSLAQQQQIDKKYGFQVIWFYCYLKYFAGKTKQQVQKKEQRQQQKQQKQAKSKNKKQRKQSSPQPKQKQSQAHQKQQQQQQSTLINKLPQQQQQSPQQNQKQPQPPIQQPQPQPRPQPLTTHKIITLLRPLKTTYSIQTIQRHSDHTLNTIKQRALLSRNDRFFVIEPEQQIKQMQRRIRAASFNLNNSYQIESCLDDMIIELYSYYLNSKNVYLIYKTGGNNLSNSNNSTNNNNNISPNNNSNINKNTKQTINPKINTNNPKSNNNNLKANNIINNNNPNSIQYENNSISSSIDSAQNRLKMILTHNSSESRLNTSKDSKASFNNQKNQRRSYGSLKSSLVIMNNYNHNNNIGNKLLQQDSILLMNNNNNIINNNNNNNAESSLIAQTDKLDNKIQQMEIIDKLAQFDGLQLWNIKYKKIPHTYVKFKKQSWTKCMNLPIIHPSVPKTINQLAIIPRITKLTPSIDKLLPFVSLIKQLQKYFPNLLPSIDSIYQYNNMPYVFLQQDNGYGSWKWQTNIGVLCYFVVFGNDQQTLSVKRVQRWVQLNGSSVLGRTIKEMVKRQKEKMRKRKDGGVRGGNNNDSINNSGNSNEKNNSISNMNENRNNAKDNIEISGGKNSKTSKTNTTTQQQAIPSQQIPSNHNNTVSSSLQMLITKDENSDLAIW